MICAICGKEFIGYNKGAKFCSEECRAKAKRDAVKRWKEKNRGPRTVQKICPVCGEEFTGGYNKLYCSKKCKTKVQNEKNRGVYTRERQEERKTKGLDGVMAELKKEGIDYKEWKLEQARKHVTPIILKV